MRVHDNEIIAYKVDLKNSKLYLYTEYDDAVHIKQEIDIVFSDVLAHYFECELSGSIILDISNYEIDEFFEDQGNLMLLERHKNNCWPMYYGTIEELKNRLRSDKYLYFIIYSSYGLNGWIIAKDYEEITQ
ncbi:hypothetical protein [Paenibacillus wynnii]|uniref:Uncharacterized protein n=1 Tax=Paenibacillus wynnii TaxID=268407 RepID=A0A098M8Q0_9BACL|nr:hypothetical protein [Paenibacillus wynnii]KGE18428.1 hypothetical protein PWYN_28410 [Paenibacillus wynnii]